MRNLVVRVLVSMSLLTLGAVAARAEANIVWPTFSIDGGAYQLTTDQRMRIDGHGNRVGTDINWSRDLLPRDETLFTLDGEWLFAERHSLGLRYQKSNR